MKKENTALKIVRITLITLLSIILLLNLCIMIQTKISPDKVPSIFGYKPFVVMSGSMETKINVGDLVLVKKVDSKDLVVGDIIAFRNSDDTVTTHRIIEVTDDGCFVTKGDNNNIQDNGIVCSKSIEGKYVRKYPRLGRFILFIKKPLGLVVLMLSLLIICAIIYLLSTNGFAKLTVSDAELKEFEEYKKNKKN